MEFETLYQLISNLIIPFFGYYFSHHCISFLLSFTFSSNIAFRDFFFIFTSGGTKRSNSAQFCIILHNSAQIGKCVGSLHFRGGIVAELYTNCNELHTNCIELYTNCNELHTNYIELYMNYHELYTNYKIQLLFYLLLIYIYSWRYIEYADSNRGLRLFITLLVYTL